MKKIYLRPSTTIVTIEPVMMIATSNPEGFNGDLGDGEGESGNGGKALSRRGGSIWDDEEDY